MKRIRRRILLFWITVFILNSLFLNLCYAQENGGIVRSYWVEKDRLHVLCQGNVNDGKWKAEAGKKNIPLEMSVSQPPVTVYCLVDVSGSMNDGQMEQMRQILTQINCAMEEEDNLVIASLGNQVTSSGLLSTQEKRQQVIDGLKQGNEDTNLYAGIVESLKELEVNKKYHPNHCLLILSDGQDDQATGYTLKEAEEEIEASGIPVHTVAILREESGDSQIEAGKLLGSLARNSEGGSHSTPVLDSMTTEQSADRIWNAVQDTALLTMKLSGFEEVNRETVLIKITYQSGQDYQEDRIRLHTDELPEMETKISETVDETESESESGDREQIRDSESESESNRQETIAEPESEEGDTVSERIDDSSVSETEKGNWKIWGMIAVTALILSGSVLYIRKKRIKKDQKVEKTEETNKRNGKDTEYPEKMIGKVWLTAIGYREITNQMILRQGESVTVGRNFRAQKILNAKDKKLSGIQCSMKWENGTLYVKDEKSKNGTFLNGVPLHGKDWSKIQNGDCLRMGSYEYRIQIRT